MGLASRPDRWKRQMQQKMRHNKAKARKPMPTIKKKGGGPVWTLTKALARAAIRAQRRGAAPATRKSGRGPLRILLRAAKRGIQSNRPMSKW